MSFPGTITVPTKVFEQIIEYAARSLKSHGFKEIYFVGDSGGNQDSQHVVAELLSNEMGR
jgi:creatinine amidohydrolase